MRTRRRSGARAATSSSSRDECERRLEAANCAKHFSGIDHLHVKWRESARLRHPVPLVPGEELVDLPAARLGLSFESGASDSSEPRTESLLLRSRARILRG